MRRAFVLACVLAAVGAGPAAAAKPGTYKGTTAGGHPISFKLAGGKLSAIDALVPTTCVSTGAQPPRAGAERFQPPGPYRVGTTRARKALQDPAMHYSEVTKHYRVALKRLRGGGFKPKLHVNFAFETLDYSGLEPRLVGWVCRGDDKFRVR